MRVKYICIKECKILFSSRSTYIDLKIDDIIYLKFAYLGAFGNRHLVYLDDNEEFLSIGDIYGEDIKNFEEYRENIIDKILK